MMAPDAESNKVDTTLITAAVVTVVGVVASLTAAGAMQRVVRNQGLLLALALGVVALGGYLLFRAALLPARRTRGHAGWWHDADALRKRGGFLIVVGVLVAVVATVLTALATERPAISAGFDSATQHLKATITAGDLGTDDSIEVSVDGLKRITDKTDTSRFTYQETQLAQYSSGPDANGEVKLQVDVPIPVGDFDNLGIRAWSRQRPKCGNVDENRGTGQAAAADQASHTAGAACVIVPVPAPRPSLTAVWEGTGQDSKAVKVTAAAANVRSHVLVVDVTVQEKAGSVAHDKSNPAVRRLQYEVVGPGAAGQAQTTLRVPVPDDVVIVCAEAHVAALPPDKRPTAVCPVPETTLAADTYQSAYAELRKL